jgi:charged multivesicular body protein 7
MKFFVALSCFLAVSQISAEFWGDFRVTYTALPIGWFDRLPRTLNDSEISNWKLVSSECTNGGRFNGFQYIVPGDISVGLLFDINGVIAGIQALFNKATLESQPGNTVNYPALSQMYQNYTVNGTDSYMLTAYFVDPATICTTGRNSSDLPINGTGTGLWIQDGPTALDVEEVPKTRAEAINNGWTQNQCFPSMGAHNFHRVEDYDPTNCTVMRPLFGLYNKEADMLGFGFIIPGTIHNDRFENPPLAAVRLILGETPLCIEEVNNSIGQTSLHVYFVDTPRFINCL